MKPLRILLVSLLLCASADTFANGQCNADCQRLINEGNALGGQGKYREALERFKAAEAAEPQSSVPVSMAAGLVLGLAEGAPPDKKDGIRAMARALAERAVGLFADDPIAHEVLRRLDDGAVSPLHAPNAGAAKPFARGEALFAQQQYEKALEQYQLAMAADPAFSNAWVAAGNTWFYRGDWGKAEALFRQATAVEPHNAQAWRYLASSLARQGDRDGAEKALLTAIAADPSQRPNWIALSALRSSLAMPLKPLALRRGVRVEEGSDGKYTIGLDALEKRGKGTPDHAFRLALGMSELQARTVAGHAQISPFAIELASWSQAIKIINEAQAKEGKGLSDPALLQMLAFERDGQLEAALLILQFRQAWRPDLQAWLAAHPGGVKTFIDRYGVRP